MKKFLLFILSLIFLFSSNGAVFAQETANNKFGIHIIDESDLENAAELVNSNGGQWGYVTVVIREDERDSSRWQRIFDKMRRLKLIPIVRIATKIENGVWIEPRAEEANNWAAFLDGLLWPVKDRYVILYNEPNHAKEWNGVIDPEGYAEIVKVYEKSFREHSDEFVILPAALDLAAPNGKDTMSAETYWERAHNQDNFIFTRFDAWNSHSYPNPGFSGSAFDTGKMSVQGYKWELDYLSNYGLDPDIDVFITETGWIAGSEDEYVKIADNYKYVFEKVWNDSRVKAVTPFLLKYIGEPFDDFSFLSESGEKKPQFDLIASLKKNKANPEQIHSYDLESTTIAKSLVSNSEYQFYINLKNTGQSIWSKEDGFAIHYTSTLDPGSISIGEIPNTEPFSDVSIPIRIKTHERGRHSITLQLNKEGEQIGNLIQANFEIIAPPSLQVRVKGWFGKSSTSDFNLVLSQEDRQILTIDDLLVVDGLVSIPEIYNVIPGRTYQITIGKEYHLAKTKNIVMDPVYNNVRMGRLLPIDLNNDDNLDYKDFISHFLNPVKSYILISPI